MLNLIRYKRGHHLPLMLSYPVLQNAGTRLSSHERNIAYSLNRYASWTCKKISCLTVIAADGDPTKY